MPADTVKRLEGFLKYCFEKTPLAFDKKTGKPLNEWTTNQATYEAIFFAFFGANYRTKRDYKDALETTFRIISINRAGDVTFSRSAYAEFVKIINVKKEIEKEAKQ